MSSRWHFQVHLPSPPETPPRSSRQERVPDPTKTPRRSSPEIYSAQGLSVAGRRAGSLPRARPRAVIGRSPRKGRGPGPVPAQFWLFIG